MTAPIAAVDYADAALRGFVPWPRKARRLGYTLHLSKRRRKDGGESWDWRCKCGVRGFGWSSRELARAVVLDHQNRGCCQVYVREP